jgi:4-hydroxy-4-methyl-2-oxoglutarate aldolase
MAAGEEKAKTRVDDAALARIAKLSSASLHEAGGKIGALPAALKPLTPAQRVCGRAFPVRNPPGDNLFLHHAIYAAAPGDVLVVDAGDGDEFGHWGDIMAAAAQLRGIAGLVITGGVRDSQQMAAMNFPVFSTSVAIKGTGKNPRGDGALGQPVTLGGVVVEEGDVVFGDADGVVVLPRALALEIADKAVQRDRDEDEILQRLRAGETTLQIYNLPDIGAPVRASRRRSIEVEGLAHGNLPIPVASRIGNIVATGGVRGVDPATGEMPQDVGAQARLMFDNLGRIVAAAGGSADDILKLTIWITDNDVRAALNDPWMDMFPDPHARPARHVLLYALPAGMRVQCEALIILQET